MISANIAKKLEQIEREGIINDLCKNIRVLPQYVDDLRQEIYLSLAEDVKVEDMDMMTLKFYLVKIIKNQWFSNTSTLYRRYRRSLAYEPIPEYDNNNKEDEENEE